MTRPGPSTSRYGLAAAAVAATLVFSAPAFATHNTPQKANKFLVTFVRGYQQCAGNTHSHNPPLSFPACDPATAGTALSFGPKGFGQAKGVVVLNAAKQASDVRLTVKLIDVRTGDDGTGAGFDGTVILSAELRSTDHDCDGASNTPCTLVDVPLAVQIPCGSFATPPVASGLCVAKTTLNAVVPGSVFPGQATNLEIQQLQVYQGSSLAFVGGLLLP